MRTHLDLFSGIGGFALAARWAGLVTVQFVEIDQRCRDFLSRTWPGVAIHDDVRTFHHDGGPVFLLTGGVPCQPASRAGKQRGCQDDRWLWPEAIRILGEVKPTWAIFENPPGIGDVGLAGILSDVEAQGYEMRVFSVPACAVGSPHRRERYWIVGKSIKDGRKQGEPTVPPTRHGRASQSNVSGILADAPRRQDDGGRDGDMAEAEGCRWGCDASAGCAGEHLADTERGKRGGIRHAECEEGSHISDELSGAQSGIFNPWSSSVWLPCADGKVRRAPDDSFGLVDGLHRSLLGALGNSIVPQVAAEIIRAIIETEG